MRLTFKTGKTYTMRQFMNVSSWLLWSFLGVLFAAYLQQYYFVPPSVAPNATPAKINSLLWNYTEYKEKEKEKEKETVSEWVSRCIATIVEKRLFDSDFNESAFLNSLRTSDSYPIHPSKFTVQVLQNDDLSIRIIDCYLL